MEPEGLLYCMLTMLWIEYIWNYYLTFRQRDVIKNTANMPGELDGIMPSETFCKARSYNLDRITFGIIKSVFATVVEAVIILTYVIPFFWRYSANLAAKFGYHESEIIVSIIFMMISNTISTIKALPLDVYSVFVIEERHGFNKQTPLFYLKDTVKSYLLMQTLIVLVIAPMIYIIKAGGQYFFVYLWLFFVFFMLFFMTIYPDVIAPLFDKYTPLEDGELRTSIEDLASSIDFPLKKIYVVEGSKRSAHSNAYFYGFYKNKRIVLFDTLLQDYQSNDSKTNKETESNEKISDLAGECSKNTSSAVVEKKGLSNNEILAVLAHELGHWKGNHVLKQLIISQINLFFLFMAFSMLFRYDMIYKAFGFYDSQPVIIGVYIIFQFIFTPYNLIISFLMTLLSRKYEFEADSFAKGLGKAEFLRSSLIKLNKDNLGFPINDWLYSTFTHSHPPLLERLEALNKTE